MVSAGAGGWRGPFRSVDRGTEGYGLMTPIARLTALACLAACAGPAGDETRPGPGALLAPGH